MKVEGIVTDINNGEVAVDIGTKHTGYIPASELQMILLRSQRIS